MTNKLWIKIIVSLALLMIFLLYFLKIIGTWIFLVLIVGVLIAFWWLGKKIDK